MSNDENPSYQTVESDGAPMKKTPSRHILLAGVGAAVIVLIVLQHRHVCGRHT